MPISGAVNRCSKTIMVSTFLLQVTDCENHMCLNHGMWKLLGEAFLIDQKVRHMKKFSVFFC